MNHRQQLFVWMVALLSMMTTQTASAFSKCTVPLSQPSPVRSGPLYAKDDAQGGGGLVQQSDTLKTQLLNAFTNLGTADQYDAVLTGLCAKILDDTALTEPKALVAIQDCLDLMTEMNQARIPASQRSLMALLDAAAKTNSAPCLASVMRLAIRNNGPSIQQYGMQQRDIRLFTTNANAKILCPDGTQKTLRERLASVEPIPQDDRATEIASAGLFGAVALTNELINWNSSPDSFEHLGTSAILTIMIAVTVLDNFYDVIQWSSNFVVAQISTDPAATKKFQLPDKTTLPGGIGTGVLTGTVVRGFSRLLTVDSARESQCEAAALYTAYVLGLPCFAYRPNALEASTLVVEESTEKGDRLNTAAGILRALIWLLAPVAMERMTHPVLIMSDPREAEGFLRRLEDYYGDENDDLLFWKSDAAVRDDLLQWAYAEADVLLRNNKARVLELSDRLNSGAATMGDCIAVIENW